MKNKMGFMHKFAYSFFDFTTYKEFLIQGLGKSVLYVFLVTLIFSTITNINTISIFRTEILNIHEKFVQSAPNFELKNGLFTMDSNEPIYYKHDGEQLIVDTSGKTNKSILDSHKNGIYIDSNELTIRQNYITQRTVKFSEFPEATLTNKSIQVILSTLTIMLPIVILIVNPLIAFIMNLISAFIILGPLTLNISSIMGVKLNYSKACTLSFYAMTLPLLLESLLDISGIALPEFIAIFYIIALIYCGLAINEIKNTDKSNLNYMK